jgi:hypothetical protein
MPNLFLLSLYPSKLYLLIFIYSTSIYLVSNYSSFIYFTSIYSTFITEPPTTHRSASHYHYINNKFTSVYLHTLRIARKRKSNFAGTGRILSGRVVKPSLTKAEVRRSKEPPLSFCPYITNCVLAKR